MTTLLKYIDEFSNFWSRHEYHISCDIIPHGIRFLSTCSEHFRKKYSVFYITKIVNVFCIFEKKIEKKRKGFPQRGLFFRLLKSSCLQNQTLGIVIVLSLNKQSEFLSKEQVFRAIQSIVPGITYVTDAFYSYRDDQKELLFLYQEIEKKRGRGFSLSELQQLEKHLQRELRESVECLSPPLFLIRNEEEIFRTIISMSQELCFVKDIPQVTISFQDQSEKGDLKFSIVILRLLKPQSLSLKELSLALPKTIRYIHEMVSNVGCLQKKYIKEANVLTLEVKSSLFSRKNASIDLRAAREYVAKALELMIGEFRDYNGGLFSKQNAKLKEIRNFMGEKERKYKLLIESFFYSFIPSFFQTLIIPEAGKAYIALFIEAIESEITHEKPFFIFKKEEEKFSLLLLKTAKEEVKNALVKEISNFPFFSYSFGYSVQCIDGFYYLGCLSQGFVTIDWMSSIEAILCNSVVVLRQEQKVLRINFQDGDPLSLNPQIGIDLRCRAVQKSLFEGLMRISTQGAVEFAAAKSVEISPCMSCYKFHLRDLYWSNGEEVTANHFEKTWKKAILSPSCLSPDIFYIIKNAKGAHFGENQAHEIGVRALSKYTLEIILEHPAPYFLELLTHPIFAPLYEDYGEPHIFNGPFSLNFWKHDVSMTLIKNPYYWDFENVGLDSIEISMIRDSHIAYLKFERGEIDWIGGPFSMLPMPIANRERKKLKKIDTNGITWLYCNTTHPLLSSDKIRRALSFSIDRDKICKHILWDHIPSLTLLPKTISQLDVINFTTSSTAICKLFEEGLQELHLTRQNLAPLLFSYSNVVGHKEVAQAIQNEWEQMFNIKVCTAEVTWNTFSHNLDKRDFDFALCCRHPFFNDPMYFFNIFAEPTHMHNACGWKNQKFDEWINLAKISPEREKFLKFAEEEFQHQMPIIPIHRVTYHYLAKEDLKNIHICHSGDVDFKWIYFE